jgi:hypothetical protein
MKVLFYPPFNINKGLGQQPNVCRSADSEIRK